MRIAGVALVLLASIASAQIGGGGGMGNPKSPVFIGSGLTYECPSATLDATVFSLSKANNTCTINVQGLVSLLGQKIGDVATDFNNPTHFGGIDLQFDGGTLSKGTTNSPTGIYLNDRIELTHRDPTVASFAGEYGAIYDGGITLNGIFSQYSMLHVMGFTVPTVDPAVAVTTDVGGGTFSMVDDYGQHDITGTSAASSHVGLILHPVIRANGVNPTSFAQYAIDYQPIFSRAAAETFTGIVDFGFRSRPVVNTGQTALSMAAVTVDDPTGSGTFTARYGVNCGTLTKGTTLACMNATGASGTGRWSILSSGTVHGFHRGCMRFGDSTPQDCTDVLEVNGNLAFVGTGNLIKSANFGTVPAFRSVGALSHSTSSIGTVALPSGHATNDLLVLMIQTSNQAPSPVCPSTYTQAGPQNGSGVAATAASNRLIVCWKRDGGSETGPAVADSGDHQMAAIAAYSGVATTGDPFQILSSGIKATASTSFSATGGTTAVDNSLVVVVGGTVGADSTSTVQCGAPTNSDLASVTERLDSFDADGSGGGFCLDDGTKLVAGTVGATTLTEATSTADAWMTLALLPNTTVTPSVQTRGEDVQNFTTAGADTWTKPTGAKFVCAYGIGGGGSGGPGRSTATAAGGGGGGGGAYQHQCWPASQLSATWTLQIGTGGIGGSSPVAATASTITDNSKVILSAGGGVVGGTAGSGDGGDGGGGGGGSSLVVPIVPGTPAATGTQSSGSVGGGGGGGTAATVTTSFAGGKGDWGGGGGASGATAANTGGTGGTSGFGGGGGAGGSITGSVGGVGGVGGQGCTGGAAHASATGSGVMTAGSCGGGGGDGTTTTGGNGAQPGGGGGGGGNAANSGGNGGDGALVVVTYF